MREYEVMMASRTDPQEVLAQLAQAARSDRLLVFVGSGISAEYGLPTWSKLAVELGNPDFDTGDLPGEFSKFVARRGARALSDLLERKLGKRPTAMARSTRLLLETRCAAIVSTNCDRIVETVARELGAPIKIFSEDDDLVDFHSTPWLRLVKLHGTLDRQSTLTFTREQYVSLPERVPALLQTVAQLMSYCQIVFLGYSMSDPDFHELMNLAGRGRAATRSLRVATSCVGVRPHVSLGVWPDVSFPRPSGVLELSNAL
jgi:hypothetical protein